MQAYLSKPFAINNMVCKMLVSRGYWTQKRPEMAEFLPVRRARVLEIGCAEGEFLSSLEGVKEAWGLSPRQPRRLLEGVCTG